MSHQTLTPTSQLALTAQTNVVSTDFNHEENVKLSVCHKRERRHCSKGRGFLMNV